MLREPVAARTYTPSVCECSGGQGGSERRENAPRARPELGTFRPASAAKSPSKARRLHQPREHRACGCLWQSERTARWVPDQVMDICTAVTRKFVGGSGLVTLYINVFCDLNNLSSIYITNRNAEHSSMHAADRDGA